MARRAARRPLVEHRRRQMLTVRDLADRSGASTSTIMAIEHGTKMPRYATMRKIAGALGVDPLAVSEFAAIIEGAGNGDGGPGTNP